MSALNTAALTAALTASLATELAAAGVDRLVFTAEISAAYGLEYEVNGFDAAGSSILCIPTFSDYCDIPRLPGTLRFHLVNLAEKRRTAMLEAARRTLATKVPVMRHVGRLSGLPAAAQYAVTGSAEFIQPSNAAA